MNFILLKPCLTGLGWLFSTHPYLPLTPCRFLSLIGGFRHYFEIHFQAASNLLHRYAFIGRVLSFLDFGSDHDGEKAVAMNSQFAKHLALGVATAKRRSDQRLRIVFMDHPFEEVIEHGIGRRRVGWAEFAQGFELDL